MSAEAWLKITNFLKDALDLLKAYGPVVGPLVLMVMWQTFQINRLLNWITKRHDDEIDRMAKIQDRLLTHILGKQPTSMDAPTAAEIKKMAEGSARKE